MASTLDVKLLKSNSRAHIIELMANSRALMIGSNLMSYRAIMKVSTGKTTVLPGFFKIECGSLPYILPAKKSTMAALSYV